MADRAANEAMDGKTTITIPWYIDKNYQAHVSIYTAIAAHVEGDLFDLLMRENAATSTHSILPVQNCTS